MLSFSRLAAAFTVAVGLSSGVHAIGKITRTGKYLYNADGSRFFIKGVAYQEQGAPSTDPNNPFSEPSTFTDPLANAAACTRDLPFLQQLSVNAIRVYSVNSSLNHDSCMQALSGAGIYAIVDLTTPGTGSIDRLAPTWTTDLLNQYIATIDAFAKYDNVLAFNVGNEVVTLQNGTAALAYVKAAARDTRAYLTSKSSSALVGYAAIDGSSTFLPPVANFLSCDPSSQNSAADSIDLFGLNNYEFCGNSTFEASYAAKTTLFANYNVVAYFSEYGCNNPSPRVWADVPALYGPQASVVWTGGVAFSYFPAASDQGEFGMVNISSDGSTVTTSQDFDNLKTQYNAVTFVNTPTQSSAPAATYPACPQPDGTFLASSTLPPTPNNQACTCLESNLSCQFNPQVSNTTLIVGPLLDTACSLVGSKGGNCDAIGGSGATGQYGVVSACDPSVKLSFVFSQYFEANNRDPQACSFSGNGTVNSNAPSTVSAANAVASSCLASATGTFVPTAPTSGGSQPPSSGSSSAGGSSGSGNAQNNAAIALLTTDARGLLGVALMFVISVAGGVWSLA